MAKKLLTKETDELAPMAVAKEVMKLERLKRDIEERLKAHKKYLLETMLELDVVSLKTGTYTLSRKQYKRIRIEDDKKASAYLEKMEVPVEMKKVLDMDLMRIPIKALLDEGKQIDGVSEIKTEYVSVRLAEKAKK